MDCPGCQHFCNEQRAPDRIDDDMWRCMNKNCKRRINIQYRAFFEQSKLDLWQVIGLTYIWCTNVMGLLMNWTLAANIQSDWFQFCRDVCETYFLVNPVQIGGVCHIVKIDESLFARQKYNCGRLVAEQWVFGGYDIQTKHDFLVPVPRRDAATLLPIIQPWVLPNTEIWTDMWAAYNNVAQIRLGQ